MGVLRGGGGGVIPTQSGRFFNSRRFSRKCGSVGGMLYLFEISKKWPFRKGMVWGGGGGGGGHIFSYRTRTFGGFGVGSNNLVWSSVVCIQGFTVLGPVLQHVVSMANFSAIVNDADFYAKSAGEGPTLQLNDMQGLSLIRTFEKKTSFVHIRTFSYIFVHFRTEKKANSTCRAQNRSLAHKQNTQRHTGMVLVETYNRVYIVKRTPTPFSSGVPESQKPRNQRALKTPMNTPQNPNESAFQIGKIVISIIPTIRTFSYIFLPIQNSRFSSDSHFFVLFRVRMGDKPCDMLEKFTKNCVQAYAVSKCVWVA